MIIFIAGSCQSEPSDLPDEKRKTYDLEDLSNTIETAAAAGVSIVDTLRTIADPDEVFATQKPVDVLHVDAPKPQTKRKPPPKPKRTFSNSSKPEIKFVSDSFVIEYYPSPPKRTQSDSAMQDATSKSQENVKGQEKYNKTQENFYINQSTVNDTIDGKSVSPSNKNQSGKDKKESNKVQSPKSRDAEDRQPTTKVVSDLDSLLVKLAAEVQKPTNVDSSSIGTNVEPGLSSLPTSDVISNTKPELSSTKSGFSDTKQEALRAKTELSHTKLNNLNTKPDNSNTNPDISSTNPEFSSTNRDFSSTKPDDEGYCSLSRKPGTRSLTMKHENQLCSDDLFRKEKLLTAFEKDTDVAEASSKVEIICSYQSDGRESQEGVVELTAENDLEDQNADSGEVNKRQAFRKGFVFYSI
jgi:hypothetical protein